MVDEDQALQEIIKENEEMTSVTTETAAPKKKAATPKKKAAAKKAAAPKKAAPKKAAAESGRGRPSPFVGKKLYKTENPNGYKLREGSNRSGYFDMIRNGMKYETYLEGGGDPGSLKLFVDNKLVEARTE